MEKKALKDSRQDVEDMLQRENIRRETGGGDGKSLKVCVCACERVFRPLFIHSLFPNFPLFHCQSSLPLFVYETLTWNDKKEKTMARMAANGGHVSFTDAVDKFDEKFERERQKFHRQLKGAA